MNISISDSIHNSPPAAMRILIAEDSLTARTILTGILKKWGYEVLAVKDGLAAWEILQQPDCPRLVILDWMMPELDGLEVIRKVRAEVTGQPPYIIILTSKDEKGDILCGLETGANDYIKKPFDIDELSARIRAGQRTVDLQTNLYETQQTLAQLVSRDPLTGIFNRRAILEELNKELSRTRRENEVQKMARLSIGYFDIDNFKTINDTYGHQAGDEILCGLTNILNSRVRSYDSLGRLGGDEFLVVVPGIDETNCDSLFQRLITAIERTPIKTCAGELLVKVSIGVATTDGKYSVDQFLECADAAMYQAKRNGGNHVVFAEPIGLTYSNHPASHV